MRSPKAEKTTKAIQEVREWIAKLRGAASAMDAETDKMVAGRPIKRYERYEIQSRVDAANAIRREADRLEKKLPL